VAIDTANNELLIASNNTSAVTVYSRTANGNVAPLRTISGVSTGLTPNGLAVDPVNNEIVVANTSPRSLTIHARTASGDLAPLRTVSGVATGLDGPAFVAVTLGGAPAGAQFHTLTPCRAVDTRGAVGPYGGPALAHLGTRTFALFGRCGIPVSARAVAVNLTVTQPTDGPGFLTLYPAGASLPLASSINYKAGQTRANSAVTPLGATGGVNVYCRQGTGAGSGTTHFILDVYGYFQ
jgi:DNA-binding beta-propeller fold protein YncE